MLHLLKIEWLKLKHYRTFWILSALFFISIYGINYIVYGEMKNRPKDNSMADALLGHPFQFPEVWQSVSYVSSFLLFIPGLLMIISITNEFSYKTHRQNIIDGLSRTQFISVKLVKGLLISLVSTLVVFLTALSFGLMESSPFAYEGMQYVGYFFLQALSYSLAALLFGVLFRRSGIAIGVFFLYVAVLENVLSGALNRYTDKFGYFLPLESADALTPFPFVKSITSQLSNRPETTYLLIACAVYLALYCLVSKRRMETADL